MSGRSFVLYEENFIRKFFDDLETSMWCDVEDGVLVPSCLVWDEE